MLQGLVPPIYVYISWHPKIARSDVEYSPALETHATHLLHGSPASIYLEESEEDVCVDGALMSLVQHDDRVLTQLLVQQRLSQQHAICHILDHCLWPCAVLEADGVADLQHSDICAKPIIQTHSRQSLMLFRRQVCTHAMNMES